MEHRIGPKVFQQLLSEGCIKETDILKLPDGFSVVFKSVSDLLAAKGIFDFLDSTDTRLPCSSFFDDWFLYAVSNDGGDTYSLLKLREQEHDGQGSIPADGDTPGVTISFIAFRTEKLLACLQKPSDENRKELSREINRVVAHRKQRHHGALKTYFSDPASAGAYLVAALYGRHIASFAQNGYLEVPERYKEILRQWSCGKASRKLARLPEFIASLNHAAGYVICDNEKIFLKDPEKPDEYEILAILATHTANTSMYSFAAEVEYHAKFLIPLAKFRIPLLGKSVYESAIRADMTIGDTEFEGPAPFYRPDSRIVKRQQALHAGHELLKTGR